MEVIICLLSEDKSALREWSEIISVSIASKQSCIDTSSSRLLRGDCLCAYFLFLIDFVKAGIVHFGFLFSGLGCGNVVGEGFRALFDFWGA